MASSKSELQALADKFAISGDQHGEEQGFGKHHSTAEYKKEEVQLFKYLCATISKDGSCEEDVSVRIIATTAAMTKYNFGK